MKKYIILILTFIFILNSFIIFSEEKEDNDDSIISTISKTDIKIGEKIILEIKIKDLNDVKILWEDMSSSDKNVDIYDKKDSVKKNDLFLEIEFSFFESGDYEDFIFTIPISKNDDGEMLYLETDKYNFKVAPALTEEEIESLKEIKDPSRIPLKAEKEQAKIPFMFSFYLKIILIVIAVIIALLLLYFFLYKKIFKAKGDEEEIINRLPPFEVFLTEIAKITFDIKEERIITEDKLSHLTEIIKMLIMGDFSINAPFETTKELITHLQWEDFESDLIMEIRKFFAEIDMIIFAKSDYNYDHLMYYYNNIKELGIKIHNYKKDKLEEMAKNGVNNENI